MYLVLATGTAGHHCADVTDAVVDVRHDVAEGSGHLPPLQPYSAPGTFYIICEFD